MLDLKAKLAAAGLVTPEDLARAEAQRGNQRPKKTPGKAGKPGKAGRSGMSGRSGKPAPALDVASLSKLDPNLDKNKLYDAVRRFVEATRLDPVGRVPSDQARSFHFPTEQGAVGRLVIEPHVSHALAQGEAAVVAYMSNHGLAHAVLASDGARAIAKLFPAWIRSLKGHTPQSGDPDAAP